MSLYLVSRIITIENLRNGKAENVWKISLMILCRYLKDYLCSGQQCRFAISARHRRASQTLACSPLQGFETGSINYKRECLRNCKRQLLPFSYIWLSFVCQISPLKCRRVPSSLKKRHNQFHKIIFLKSSLSPPCSLGPCSQLVAPLSAKIAMVMKYAINMLLNQQTFMKKKPWRRYSFALEDHL